MTYREHLEKIMFFTNKTVEIYIRYAKLLKSYELDYRKMLISVNVSINTRRLMISAIKSYYKFIGDNRYDELILPKKEIKFNDYVSYKEYRHYLEKINIKTKTGFQKWIIVRLLFETGLRANELLNIKNNDILDNRIKIYGKGRKERCVFMSEWLRTEVNRYIQTLNSNILFPFGYKNLYKKISILDKNKKLTLHMFRRGYAKYCYKKGVSIYDISLSMGHSSVETTSHYIKRKSEDVMIFQIF